MAILRANTHEGATAGAVVSTANSGGASGNAYSYINIDTGVGVVYTTVASQGTRGVEVDSNSLSGVGAFGWNEGIDRTSGQDVFVYLDMRRSSLPSASLYVVRAMGGTNAFRVRWDIEGTISLWDANGVKVWTSTQTLPLNQWVTFGVRCRLHATAGELELRWWDDPLAVGGTVTGQSGVKACPTLGSCNQVRLGNTSSNNSGKTLFDHSRVATAWITGTTTGTVSAGSDQTVAAGSTVNLSASGSPSGGTYSWSRVSGTTVTLTGATTATPTYTAPSTGSTTWRVSYTPPDSSPVTDDVTITYQAATAPTLVLAQSSTEIVDLSGSTGIVSTSLTHVSGPVLTVTSPSADVYSVAVPNTFTGSSTFQALVTGADAQTASQMVTVSRDDSGGTTRIVPARLVYQNEVWS